MIEESLKTHRKRELKRLFIILGFIDVAFISLIFDIATSPSLLASKEVLNVLLSPFLPKKVNAVTLSIVCNLRLPVALMALVVGATLGIGGAEIQALLSSPMASPYTLELAAASGFGVSLVIAFGSFGLPLVTAAPIGAFLMTMLAASVLFGFASFKRFDSAMLVLVGISLPFLFQPFLSLVQHLFAPEIPQQTLFWPFGSLLKPDWTDLPIVSIVTLVCVLLLLRDSWALTALKLDEARAKSMGINLNSLRFKTLVLVSIITATVTSFVSVIGLIGLVSPHIARMLVGEDQRFFLPSAIFMEVAFLSLAFVLSKVIIPGALFPAGIITSLIGVPFFFWIIFSRKDYVKA